MLTKKEVKQIKKGTHKKYFWRPSPIVWKMAKKMNSYKRTAEKKHKIGT